MRRFLRLQHDDLSANRPSFAQHQNASSAFSEKGLASQLSQARVETRNRAPKSFRAAQDGKKGAAFASTNSLQNVHTASKQSLKLRRNLGIFYNSVGLPKCGLLTELTYTDGLIFLCRTRLSSLHHLAKTLQPPVQVLWLLSCHF